MQRVILQKPIKKDFCDSFNIVNEKDIKVGKIKKMHPLCMIVGLNLGNGIMIEYYAVDNLTVTSSSFVTFSQLSNEYYNLFLEPKNSKKRERVINISFNDWIDVYEKLDGIGDGIQITRMWNKLSDDVRTIIMNHTKKYVLEFPDKQFRFNATKYLREKKYLCEITSKSKNNGKQSNSVAEWVIGNSCDSPITETR